MALPQKLTLAQLSNQWASQLDPVLKNPVTNPGIVQNIPIVTGANVINHKLGRNLQGWVVTRMQNAYATLYDTQSTNPTPSLTLNLVASGPTTIDLMVF